MEYYLLLLLLLHYKEERDPIQYYLIALTDMIYPIRWGWKREKTPYPNPSLVVLIRMLSTISFSLDFMVVLQYLLVNRIRELFAPPQIYGRCIIDDYIISWQSCPWLQQVVVIYIAILSVLHPYAWLWWVLFEGLVREGADLYHGVRLLLMDVTYILLISEELPIYGQLIED